jgi:uncharacterized protein (DUF305 family)
MTSAIRRRAAAALFLLATAACGGASTQPPAPAPEPRPALSPDEIEAIYRARTDSARMRFTDADVHFVTGMIGHHAQALVMAGMAPSHGAGPSIRTLAGRIINAQQDEIELMRQWLIDRDQVVPEVHIEGTRLMVHGAGHAMNMPGMLTDGQLSALDAARGAEFDRLFLTLMIQHHRGAVTMVHDLFRTDGAGQDEAVFKLASDIQADQSTEVARMELMLDALPADGGMP